MEFLRMEEVLWEMRMGYFMELIIELFKQLKSKTNWLQFPKPKLFLFAKVLISVLFWFWTML